MPTVTIPENYAKRLDAGIITDVHTGVEVTNQPLPGSNPYTSSGFNPLPTNDARLNAEAFRIATKRYAEMTTEQQEGTNVSFLAIEIANELVRQRQPVPDSPPAQPPATAPVPTPKQANTMQPSPIQFSGGQAPPNVAAPGNYAAQVQQALDSLKLEGLTSQPAQPRLFMVLQPQGGEVSQDIVLPAHWARVSQDKQTGVAELVSVTVDTRIDPSLMESVTVPSDGNRHAILSLYILDAEGNVDNTATHLTYTVAYGTIPTVLGVFYTLTFFIVPNAGT